MNGVTRTREPQVLHTGFPQMCHYLFVLCTEPRDGYRNPTQGADPRPDRAL